MSPVSLGCNPATVNDLQTSDCLQMRIQIRDIGLSYEGHCIVITIETFPCICVVPNFSSNIMITIFIRR